jgi:regulator of sigma E protease
LTQLAGEPIRVRDDVFRLTAAHHGQKVSISYIRNNQPHTVTVQLRDHNSGGYLGASPSQQTTAYATWSAPIVGVGTTAQLSWATLQGLGSMVAKLGHSAVAQVSGSSTTRQAAQTELAQVGDQVAGPIGIVGVIFPAAIQAGPQAVLLLMAIVSLTLAVMNTLPIPALDGGRWWLMTVFRLLRRPLTQEVEERINTVGFLVLIGLIIVVSIVDVGKLV